MSFLRYSHHSNINQSNTGIERMLDKIISGGQTGVDRAALDVAIGLGIPHGGWCPKGRKAEDGKLDDRYELMETESEDYSERTKRNIRDSDATLIIVPSTPIQVTDGTILTIHEVKEKSKLFLIVDLSEKEMIKEIADWILNNNIQILNIAGPRESQSPGIYQSSSKILFEVLELVLTNKNQFTSSYNK